MDTEKTKKKRDLQLTVDSDRHGSQKYILTSWDSTLPSIRSNGDSGGFTPSLLSSSSTQSNAFCSDWNCWYPVYFSLQEVVMVSVSQWKLKVHQLSPVFGKGYHNSSVFLQMNFEWVLAFELVIDTNYEVLGLGHWQPELILAIHDGIYSVAREGVKGWCEGAQTCHWIEEVAMLSGQVILYWDRI